MSTRSSEFNKTPEKSEPFPPNDFSGISYNSNLAKVMAQFGDEEFMSTSKAVSQIFANDVSWKQNNHLPSCTMDYPNKGRSERSCLSGVYGDVGLIMDGGRMSIGEYFQRRGGATGHLSIANASDAPSLGLDVKSPEREGQLRPLVDDTPKTEGFYEIYFAYNYRSCTYNLLAVITCIKRFVKFLLFM